MTTAETLDDPVFDNTSVDKEEKAAELYQDSTLFDQYIRTVTKAPVKGEEDIYEISSGKYVHIYLSESSDGYLGIITQSKSAGYTDSRRMCMG